MQKGQSLIETLAALAIGIVLLTVITVMVLSALRNTQNISNQSQATMYAQSGMEIVRQLRDADWDTFDSLSGDYCMADSCFTVNPGEGDCGRMNGLCRKNLGIFSRQITFEKASPLCKVPGENIRNTRVSVNVMWADNTCPRSTTFCRHVENISCFSNTRLELGI